LEWLKYHPVPSDDCRCAIHSNTTTSLDIYPAAQDEDDFEALSLDHRKETFHCDTEKLPAVSWPFNSNGVRKLPWDSETYPAIETRPNRPQPRRKELDVWACQKRILENGKVVTPDDASQAIQRRSREFKLVEFWIKSSIGLHYFVSKLFKFGFSQRFQDLERECGYLALVVYPTKDPHKYESAALPQPLVVHRLVSRIDTKAVVVCAAALGTQAVDRHPARCPTEALVRKVAESGFDALWFCQEGIASILVLESWRLVPLYGAILGR
jgi:hypothetical protein